MRVQTLWGAITQLSYPEVHGMVVPTDPAEIRGPDGEPAGRGIGAPNDTNLGIESVYVTLFLEGVILPLEDLDEEAFDNTDRDTMVGNPTRNTSNELLEIVDWWGNPIAYFHGPDMQRWERYKRYVMSDGRVVDARPWRSRRTGEFINTDSFQLFSAGPDQIFNTDDDIRSW